MIQINHIETYGWEAAIRGMRNPLNSWHLSDSQWGYGNNFTLGPKDLDLAKRLSKAGSDHRKFMRQIFVSMDITAPLYWWKEYDTYKVGTVANSTSTMHTIHKKPFTLDDFSHEHLTMLSVDENGNRRDSLDPLVYTIDYLNHYRECYNRAEHAAQKKRCFHQLIQLLPSSFNQLRTVTLNYENLMNMYHARRNHKLDEWRVFCKVITELPYSEIITGEETTHEWRTLQLSE